MPELRPARARARKLEPGNVFAVEPMVNAGGPDTAVLDDGWSVVTADGRLSAHFEHTIAITDDGPEILTLPLSRPLAIGASTALRAARRSWREPGVELALPSPR